MTPDQLKLARWLASSPALHAWGAANHYPSLPAVCVRHNGAVVASSQSARGTGYYFACGWVPDITSPLMVGPLIEMLPPGALQRTHVGAWALTRDRQAMTGHGDTDAEALCALLRAVAS